MKNIVDDYSNQVAKMKQEYEKYLKPLGIKMPKDTSIAFTWLVYLYSNIGKLISKDDITKFTKLYHKGISGDQQIRHLNDPRFNWGYDVRGSGRSYGKMPDGSSVPYGYYILVSMKKPHSRFFIRPSAKKADKLLS